MLVSEGMVIALCNSFVGCLSGRLLYCCLDSACTCGTYVICRSVLICMMSVMMWNLCCGSVCW